MTRLSSEPGSERGPSSCGRPRQRRGRARLSIGAESAQRRTAWPLQLALVLCGSAALGCSAPAEPGSGGARGVAPYTGPTFAAPSPAPAAPPPVTTAPRPSEMAPAVDVSMLEPAAPAPMGAMPEPPLSAEERAALGGIDGLVNASAWNGLRATLVTQDKVLRAYLSWKQQFQSTCDDGSAYVLKTDIDGTKQVVSEGIAYGMLITVAVGDRPVFDGLWKHYKERRNDNGLMNWRYDVCGGQTGGNGASDADLDAAMGLVLADSRWGGYGADALALIDAIGTNETQICGDGRIVLKPGDRFGGCGDIVNPSYFSPGYYRRFALLQSERADFWNQLTADTYALLSTLQSQSDGLIPDWARPDGSMFDDGRENFGYEAVRGPWRVAIDYAWSGSEEAKTFLQGMSAHVESQGGLAALADSDAFDDKRNSAFLGTLSLPGIVTTQAQLDAYVSDWESYEKDDVWYYQATLRLLALLVAGGYFPAEY